MKAGKIFILGLSWVMVMGTVAMAQYGPDSLWMHLYGGPNADVAFSVIQTDDRGFIFAGRTIPVAGGERDVYVVKTDNMGQTEWSRTYGDSLMQEAYCINYTRDHGFILGGATAGPNGSADFYLVKIDSVGDTLWTKTCGGGISDRIESVEQTTDGGYIVGGCGWQHLVKTDSLGNLVWMRSFGLSSHYAIYAVHQTPDGGYILGGWDKPNSHREMYLVKTDSQGNTEWERSYGGITSWAMAFSLQQTSDGGYVLAGQDGASCVLKTDSVGDMQWMKTYFGFGANLAEDICQTVDGGYVIVGKCNAYTYSQGIYIVKLNGLGVKQWVNVHGGGSSGDEGYSVRQTIDDRIIIAGRTQAYGAIGDDAFLLKIDKDNFFVSMNPIDFGTVTIFEQVTVPLTIYNISDTTLIFNNISTSSPDFTTNFSVEDSLLPPGDSLTIIVFFTPAETTLYNDTLYIESNCESLVVDLMGMTEGYNQINTGPSSHTPSSYMLNRAFPNPFNPSTTISYEMPVQGRVRVNIYNIMGQEVAVLADGVVSPGSYSVVWEAKDLPSGIYFVRMKAGNFNKVRKVVLLK